MSKREKIIVVCMVIAVTYGAYVLLFESSSSKKAAPISQNSPTNLDGFVGEIAQRLSGSKQSLTGTYVLEQAETEWEKDPFADNQLDFSLPNKEDMVDLDDLESQFVYSGFLKMGKRGMAIINGLEYETGDSLIDAGYIVKKITSTRVVLNVQNSEEDLVLLLTDTE